MMANSKREPGRGHHVYYGGDCLIVDWDDIPLVVEELQRAHRRHWAEYFTEGGGIVRQRGSADWCTVASCVSAALAERIVWLLNENQDKEEGNDG